MALKVLHLPTSVGGYAWGLAQGEKALGLKSEVLITSGNWLNYEYDINLNLDQINNKYLRLAKQIKTFIKIRSKYDIYHFNFGSSLIDISKLGLYLADLPFYNKKAKLFVTYNGSDARQISKVGKDQRFTNYENIYHYISADPLRDIKKSNSIDKMSRYVKKMFAVNPDLLWFLPKDTLFVPYAIHNFNNIRYSGPICQGKRITVIHAPTNKLLKGSEFVIKAMEKVKEKYFNVEFFLIDNLPHEKAIKIYAKADIVIDQLILGWYGGFAAEVMKMGKPVICYIREDDLHFIPDDMKKELPIIRATKDDLYDVLCKCIDNYRFLQEKANQSLEYVLKWHDPRFVAGIVKEYYEM